MRKFCASPVRSTTPRRPPGTCRAICPRRGGRGPGPRRGLWGGRAAGRWGGRGGGEWGGGRLVLPTTLRALRAIGAALQQQFAAAPGARLQVLVQGQWPQRRLMERFRAGADNGQPGCILVASATFREGFDVPGEALQLVVIDKL